MYHPIIIIFCLRSLKDNLARGTHCADCERRYIIIGHVLAQSMFFFLLSDLSMKAISSMSSVTDSKTDTK